MCGSAEGPSPEQLAHPPLSAVGRWLDGLYRSATIEALEAQQRTLEALSKPIYAPDRFITFKVRSSVEQKPQAQAHPESTKAPL